MFPIPSPPIHYPTGVVAEKLNFSLSTTYISFGFLIQTILTVMWAGFVWRAKSRSKTGKLLEHQEPDEKTPILSGASTSEWKCSVQSGIGRL